MQPRDPSPDVNGPCCHLPPPWQRPASLPAVDSPLRTPGSCSCHQTEVSLFRQTDTAGCPGFRMNGIVEPRNAVVNPCPSQQAAGWAGDASTAKSANELACCDTKEREGERGIPETSTQMSEGEAFSKNRKRGPGRLPPAFQMLFATPPGTPRLLLSRRADLHVVRGRDTDNTTRAAAGKLARVGVEGGTGQDAGEMERRRVAGVPNHVAW